VLKVDIKEEIINIIENSLLQSGNKEIFRTPLVGFSSASDPLYIKLKEIVGPQHLLPENILKNARTVVSFFLPFSEDIVLSNKNQEEVSYEWAKAYIVANSTINQISIRIAEYLNKKGIKTATIKATHNFDEKTLMAGWSHRSAAYIAGLGTFGVNRMIITPAGCAGRFGSVIISREIEPDKRPEDEYCIYYKTGSCLRCVESCPVSALHTESFDRFTCYEHLLKTAERFKDIGLCDVCGKCVVHCPFALKH
jgi:epoxyqueuosine reductase